LGDGARVAQTRVKKCKVYLEGAFPKEKVQDVVKWAMDKLLTGWLAGFLASRSQQAHKITALGKDTQDGLAFAVVLAALTKNKTDDLASMSEGERLMTVADLAAKLGLDVSPTGLQSGSYWQHYVLAASLLLKATEIVW